MITASAQFLPTNSTISMSAVGMVFALGIIAAFITSFIVHRMSRDKNKSINSVLSGGMVYLMSLLLFPVLSSVTYAENRSNLEENVASVYQVESVKLTPASQNPERGWTGTVVSDGYEREVLVIEDRVTFEPKIISYDEKVQIPKR